MFRVRDICMIGAVNTEKAGGSFPQFLKDQLTLSQPGGLIMPTTVLPAPQIFRPCDGPEQCTNFFGCIGSCGYVPPSIKYNSKSRKIYKT